MKNTLSKIISLAMVCLLLSSCNEFTKKLWRDDNASTTYSDEFRQFLVTENGDSIVIIGRDYHYIFPATQILKDALNWKYRNDIKPIFTNFLLSTNGSDIEGSYELRIEEASVTPEKQLWLQNHNFQYERLPQVFTYNGMSKGKRYKADPNLKLNDELEKPFVVYIKQQSGAAGTGYKLAMTPITVAADGAATILLVGTVVGLGILYVAVGK